MFLDRIDPDEMVFEFHWAGRISRIFLLSGFTLRMKVIRYNPPGGGKRTTTITKLISQDIVPL
jgi:hypothetical protein